MDERNETTTDQNSKLYLIWIRIFVIQNTILVFKNCFAIFLLNLIYISDQIENAINVQHVKRWRAKKWIIGIAMILVLSAIVVGVTLRSLKGTTILD